MFTAYFLSAQRTSLESYDDKEKLVLVRRLFMSQILLQTAKKAHQLGETAFAVSPLTCKMAAVSVGRNNFLLSCVVKYGVIRPVYEDQLALQGVYITSCSSSKY